MERGIVKVLVTEEEVKKTVKRLGAEVTAYYGPKKPDFLVIGLLRGSFVFLADLVREIKFL